MNIRELLDAHRAEFEFGNLADGVEGVGGEDVGGSFAEVEGDEDAAGLDRCVGSNFQADRAAAAADRDWLFVVEAELREIDWIHRGESVPARTADQGGANPLPPAKY